MKLSDHPNPHTGMRVRSILTNNHGTIRDVAATSSSKCLKHDEYHARTIRIRWDTHLMDSVQTQCDMENIEVV